LTGKPIKNADLQAGFALFEEQGLSFEKDTLATPSKLYHFPKKEHCKIADVPAFAMLQP